VDAINVATFDENFRIVLPDTEKDWCIVVNHEGDNPVFGGTTENTVKWLEENPSKEPRFVYIKATTCILTESQFLDLAT
jgi:hypothetical protein